MTSVVDVKLELKRLSRHILPALFFLALAACSETPEPIELSGATMGTSYHLTWLEAKGLPEPEQVHSGVEAILGDINDSMSTYRPDSEINRFNSAAAGEWIVVSPAFLEVFLMAREVAEASGHAYDVTVGPLVNLWGFGPEQGDEVPLKDAITEAMAMVGEQRVDVNAETSALRKQETLELDFSSIAKGYAVDKVAEWMAGQGIDNYLVEIGGEIRVAGVSPRGTPWRIAVERPDPVERQIVAALELREVAVATSGDYRNFFEFEGERFSHSIDPRTGWPVRHELISVSVVHESATLADAWATALTILGPGTAWETAVEEGLAVYLISRDGEDFLLQKTPAMDQWLL
jgi:thiamine biosynthesis lipoprotein